MSAEYRRVVRPLLRDQPPPTIEQVARESRWQRFVVNVARPLWGFRVELTAAVSILLAHGWLSRRITSGWGIVVLGVLAALVATSARGRRLVWHVYHRSRLRRRWNLAVRHARLATHNDRIPRPVTIRTVASGDRLRVRVPLGGTVSALQGAAEAIAAVLGVREVQVTRDRDNARYASVVVVRRDPLAGGEPIPWPERGPATPALRAVGEESAS